MEQPAKTLFIKQNKKMKKTLRTLEHETEYQNYKKSLPKGFCPFCKRDLFRKEFMFWVLIENRWWYNDWVMAQNHYLLSPKRHISEFEDLSEEERKEFFLIKKFLMTSEGGEWESVMENLGDARSIPEHLHFQVLRKFKQFD